MPALNPRPICAAFQRPLPSRIITSIIYNDGEVVDHYGHSIHICWFPAKQIWRIKVDEACVTRMEKAGLGCRDTLDIPISEEELEATVNTETCNKSPGREDIWRLFFKVNWDSFKDDMLTLVNQMYLVGRKMEPQKHAIVVCISKTDIPKHQRTADQLLCWI